MFFRKISSTRSTTETHEHVLDLKVKKKQMPADFYYSLMEKQKSQLLEALTKSGIATAKLSILNNGDKQKLCEELENIYADALKFCDAYDAKVSVKTKQKCNCLHLNLIDFLSYR